MKKYLPLIFTLLPLISYSQDIIYKCTSPKGEINYVNLSSAAKKNSGCVKTDIAVFDMPIVRSVENKKSPTNNTTSGGSGMAVYSDDQKNRDSKRQTVLQKELEEEENQLSTVNNSITTLNNSKGSDPKQIQDLNNLQVIHKKNIESLKKELGIKDNAVTVATPLKIEKMNTEVSKNNEKPNILTK